jgi:hypothetical protein
VARREGCRFNSGKGVNKSASYQRGAAGNEESLRTLVGTIGPADVAIDASKQTLEIKVDGHAYVCTIGEEEKKATNSNNTSSQVTYPNSNRIDQFSPYSQSVPSPYDFDPSWDLSWDWDVDWDDLDW